MTRRWRGAGWLPLLGLLLGLLLMLCLQQGALRHALGHAQAELRGPLSQHLAPDLAGVSTPPAAPGEPPDGQQEDTCALCLALDDALDLPLARCPPAVALRQVRPAQVAASPLGLRPPLALPPARSRGPPTGA